MSDGESSPAWWRNTFPAMTSIAAIAPIGAGILALLFGAGIPTTILVVAFGWLVVTPVVSIVELFVLSGSPATETVPSATDEAVTTADEDSIETLRERYVRGDLTDAEFERRVEERLRAEDGEAIGDAVGDWERDRAVEFDA